MGLGSSEKSPPNPDLPLKVLWIIPTFWPYQSHFHNSWCPSCSHSNLGSILPSVVHLCHFKRTAVCITGDTQCWVNPCQKTHYPGMQTTEIMELYSFICIINDTRWKFYFLVKTESLHWVGAGTEQRKVVQREDVPCTVYSITLYLHLWNKGLEETLFCNSKFRHLSC